MNKTHRTIFNIATGTWVAASETAKSRTKSSGQRALVRHAIALAAVTLGLGATQAFAYVAGNGAQQGNANNTVIGDNADGSAAGCNSSYLPGSACSTIIGNSASSTAGATTAIGDHASTTGANSVAIGAYATASSWSQAIGAGAKATGGWATAIGQNAVASASNALSLGTNSSATGDTSVAVGSAAKATGTNSFALGYSANAQGVDSMAFGRSVTVAGDKSVALGSAAKTTGDNAMALGANTSAVAGSVALGQSSIADRANTVSVGSSTAQRQITNLAAGTATTDAVNVGQLNTAATQLGNQITNVSNNLTQLGDQISNGQIGLVQQSGPGADLTIGAATDGARVDFADKGGNTRTLANVSNGVADTDAVNVRQLNTTATQLGDQITNVSNNVTQLGDQISSGQIGLVQQAATGADLTVGAATDGVRVNFADKNGNTRTLANISSGVADTDAVSVQQLRTEIAKSSATDTAYFQADGWSNKGDKAQVAAGSYGVAIGSNASATGENSVALGANSVADRDNVVSVGWGMGGNGTRQIVNVANGNQATDAVNVQQLTPVIASLGGGAKIDANTGVVSGPTYNVQGGTQHDVGTALDAIDSGLKTAQNNIVNLDGRVTNNETNILNLQQQLGQGSIGLVQQDAATRNITVAGGTDGTVVDFTGTAGARRLTGVAEGSTDTDAVNVSQLKKTGLIDNNGNTLAAVTYDLHADGTANYNSVTLGGTQASGPVQLHNVADGAADTDAVNLRQLKQAGLIDQNGTALDAVTYDAGSNRTSVTFGSAGTPVLLSNVRAGMADTDAANVGQLRGLAGSLGGGAGFAPDGSFVAPTYTLNNTTYNTVGDALNGLAVSIGQTGDRVTTIEKVISTGASNAHVATTGDQANTASATGNTAVAIGAGAAAKHDNSVALGAGSTTDRDNTVSVGSVGSERVVANVADAVMSTDAVNKRSMDAAVSGANSYTDQKVGMVQQALGDVSRKAYSGIAGATALTMIPDADAGKTVAVGVGVATYEGYTASAIGVSTRLSDRIKAKFGASISGSSSTYGAGVSYQW
ncbi:YadA-like family protein [Ralstonia sp. 1138]|uniref:YadA-like family protein n=1 Tax=Ralstonia sp. 1138 TaxID=3156423 RepID=UPI0033990A54